MLQIQNRKWAATMNYKMLDNTYLNTGGGCMVNITTIFDRNNKKTLYVMTNEEGGTLCSADYIRFDVDYDEVDMIDYFSYDTIEPQHCFFELYQDCWREYAKADFKHFKNYSRVPIKFLPEDLKSQLTSDYIAWCNDESDGCVESNGNNVVIDDNYCPPDPNIIAAKILLDYMHEEIAKLEGTDEERQQFYDIPITITFGAKAFFTTNGAAIYSALEGCLRHFIDQY